MLKNIYSKKIIRYTIILFTAIGFLFFFWYFINLYLTRSKATGTSITLSLLPSQLNFNVGEIKEVNLMMQFNSGNQSEKIDYLKVVLNFPKDTIELADYIDTTSSGLSRQMRVDGPVAANSSGEIVIEIGAPSPNSGPSTTQPVTVAKMKFKGKASGSGQISIGNSQIVNNSSEEITVGEVNNSQITVASSTPTPPPGATNTPTPTSPPGVTNLALNLTLRFQGIINQCPSGNKKIKTRVKLGGRTNTAYQTADFSCNQGKWTGSVSFNAPAGSGYIVYVKGEKHLQKKVCDQMPQESTLGPGTYNCRDGKITLNSGGNNLDFSGILNLYGDLPVGGSQDGVINALDSSYIRNNLGSTDPEVLAICDGNLDSRCDTQDWSMLIMALSIKGDEL